MQKRTVIITLIKYLVCFAVGALIVVLTLVGQRYFSETVWEHRCKMLCDAFTLAGVILLLFYALVWVSNKGAFLGIGYAFGRFFRTILPFLGKSNETYAEYRERKVGRGGIRGLACMLIAGAVYFAVAIILLIVYFQIPTV